MACCVAMGVLIALVRALWFRIFPSRAPVRPGFAPPARRSAPVSLQDGPVPAETTSAPAGLTQGQVVSGRWISPPVAVALALAVYLVVVGIAVGTGLLSSGSSAGLWWLRTLLFVAVAVGALWWAARRPAAFGRDSGASGSGPAVMAAGAAWFVAGMLDRHGFSLIGGPPGSSDAQGAMPAMTSHPEGASAAFAMLIEHLSGTDALVLHGPAVLLALLGLAVALHGRSSFRAATRAHQAAAPETSGLTPADVRFPRSGARS